MNPQSQREMDTLKESVEKLQRDLDEYKRENEKSNRSIVDAQGKHTHGGSDQSSYIYNDGPVLKPGQGVTAGRFTLTEAVGSVGLIGRMIGGIVAGDDSDPSDGSNNAQFAIDFNKASDTTNFFGLAAPIFTGSDAIIAIGGSTMTTSQHRFGTNELAGKSLVVVHPDGSSNGFIVASNTETTVTITGGSWSFSRPGNGEYIIFTPVYLGFSTTPWRRAYLHSGTAGGLRFGFGATGDGNNGLLYMDTDGRCKFRRPDGTVDLI